MTKYRMKKVTPTKTNDTLVFPSESLEDANLAWEKEMTEKYKFTRSEIDAFKKVRTRTQFSDYCDGLPASPRRTNAIW